jgi:hypothetical protein
MNELKFKIITPPEGGSGSGRPIYSSPNFDATYETDEK